MSEWWIYKCRGTQVEHAEGIDKLPAPPDWRAPRYKGEGLDFDINNTIDEAGIDSERGEKYGLESESDQDIINMVNSALYLRRPLLITGKPGTGKSSLAYSVAFELKLGPVLRWPITTRSTLQEGLYRYDALGRLQETSQAEKEAELKVKKGEDIRNDVFDTDIGKYIELGALGTALLPYKRPRVLLIDEIDKSDIDLPNDLLHVFEEGEYKIPELIRFSKQNVRVMPFNGKNDRDRVELASGIVQAKAFPIVFLTSNGEREFPPAFLRRCLLLDIPELTIEKLTKVVELHFKNDQESLDSAISLLSEFAKPGKPINFSTDKLLNSIFLTARSKGKIEKEMLRKNILRFKDDNQ